MNILHMNHMLFGRHCLWILGSSTTLSNNRSIWQDIVENAKRRGCFFDAKNDKDLSNIIDEAVVQIDSAENLHKMDSMHISRPRFEVLLLDPLEFFPLFLRR